LKYLAIGETHEKFPDQQESMFPLLAQKEGWKEQSLMGSQQHRKGYPHLWKGGDAIPGLIGGEKF